MAEFEVIYPFPQAVGAIDRCHIRFKAPNENSQDYVNRKDCHSIFCKAWYIFRDIFAGWTCKSHDAMIFENSPLFKD